MIYSIDRRRFQPGKYVLTANLRSSSIPLQNIHTLTNKNVYLSQGIFSKKELVAMKEFVHSFLGTPTPINIMTDSKSLTRCFEIKNNRAPMWNICYFVLQYNFVITHNLARTITAADFLSRWRTEQRRNFFLRPVKTFRHN